MKCNGSKKCLFAWAKEAGLNYTTLVSRIRRWGEGCDAVLKPVSEHHAKANRIGQAARRAKRFRIPPKKPRR